MDCDDSSLLSDCSSPLSSVVDSPSPPPEISLLSYPSPPASQDSSDSDSRSPHGMDSVKRKFVGDGTPPAKKRRTYPRKERTTEYLDLRATPIAESEQAQLDNLLKVLHKRRKIVVVAGAGISVSAGIPDFRSANGIFKNVKAEYNLKGSGKDLFDASVYKDDSSTSSFHDMVRSMSDLTRNAKPTLFHHMLATLAHDGRLLRLYTQNVDGIDTNMEPLATTVPLKKTDGKWPKTVQLHGGLDKMECTKCKQLSDFDAARFDGPEPPACQECVELDRVRTNVAGKRSHGIGRLRPRMVLYNEHNPDDVAIGEVVAEDLRKRPDAIIVVGTSLKIPGVRRIVREMCATVRDRRDGVAIWLNNDPEPTGVEFKDCWDIVVRGKCDEVANLAALRKWFEKDAIVEYTAEDWEKACRNKTQPRVIINPTFKALDTTSSFRKSLVSPDYSPMADRTVLLSEGEMMSGEDGVLGAPPTPSKSVRNSPVRPKPSALDLIKAKKSGAPKRSAVKSKPVPKKATAKATAKTPAKARPASKKAAASKSSVPKNTVRINLALKQTKSMANAAEPVKQAPSPSKDGHVRTRSRSQDVMRPLDDKDARVNSPPSAQGRSSSSHSFKRDPRMSLESVMS